MLGKLKPQNVLPYEIDSTRCAHAYASIATEFFGERLQCLLLISPTSGYTVAILFILISKYPYLVHGAVLLVDLYWPKQTFNSVLKHKINHVHGHLRIMYIFGAGRLKRICINAYSFTFIIIIAPIYDSKDNFFQTLVINVLSRLISSRLLANVERLETRGYEMSLSDALKVMGFFDWSEMFDTGKSWNCSEEFASQAKRAMLNPNLSLHDLIQLRPDEAARLLADTNPYYHQYLHLKFSEQLQEELAACIVHMCEKISRGFFRSWATISFLDLTGCELPVLCCENIIENLKNEDFYRICLAAASGSDVNTFCTFLD
ncbi:unnamed protein product [Trichogramma brassicae]|uniref:Uncharacterized protein n=1 Tax=Trichogramma brassicae TaxID=86971 RepID=A0A6H5I8V2_9HYME|nr:unnamed protein product [Trichogramma brassicae]